ncbi:MAG: nuclear transport factor 2 family protein [Kiloniellales bacterium]
MSENRDVTIELLEQIVDAFNRKDLDAIVDGFAEDGVFLLAAGPDPWGCRFQGKEAIREALSERFAAVPDIRWTDGQHWISGNKALSEWRVQGTLADGKRLDCLGCDLWEFRGGKVTKKDTYYKQVTR